LIDFLFLMFLYYFFLSFVDFGTSLCSQSDAFRFLRW